MRSMRNEQPPMAICANRGFTLIELMVVLVILAILAAIEYPSYMESVRKARRAEGRTALMQIMQQQERYYSQHGSYIAFSSAAPHGYKWFSGNSAADSSYEIVARECAGDMLDNCVLLVATPGTKNVNAGYEDDVCGELTLASNGIKTASGHGSQCW